MKALLSKQLHLVSHPMTLVFALFGVLILIPSYPYTISFFYVTLGIFFMYMNAREQKDLYYSSLLPIRKCDMVKAGILFSIIIEVLSLLIAIPFVILSARINPVGTNEVGLDANVALFGFGALIYAVFNLIFYPEFYKSGYKVGVSFLKAVIPVTLIIIISEVLPHIPGFELLNDTSAAGNVQQIPICIVGLVLFALGSFVSYRISASRFEKVDL